MNMILWNCRGVGSKGFAKLIDDLAVRYSASLVVLFETHISGDKALKLVKRFGFDGTCIVDGDGFAGGIWCIWKKNEWQVYVESTHKQFAHMKVKWRNQESFFFTAVYRSPHSTARKQL